MTLTYEFLMAKHACADGLAWFKSNFGEEADYQAALNLLAKEEKVAWAEWVFQAVGPINETMELSADTRIEGHLFAAGSIRCTGSFSASLSIKAGEGIEAGEDFGIYCGLNVRFSRKAELAIISAKTRPANILLGEYREVKP